MDLTSLSAVELRDLQNQVVRELKKREQEDVVQAREQILAIAQRVGIPLKELVAAPQRAHKPVGIARYRHPHNTSLQWSGRGRQPRWIKEWLAAGQALDGLRA